MAEVNPATAGRGTGVEGDPEGADKAAVCGKVEGRIPGINVTA